MNTNATVKIERAYHAARALVRSSLGAFGLSMGLMAAGIAARTGVLTKWGGYGLGATLLLGLAAWIAWSIERRRARRTTSEPAQLRLEPGAVVAGGARIAIDEVKMGWVDGADRVAIEHDNGDQWLIDGLEPDEQQRLLEHIECDAAQRALHTNIAGPYQANFGCLRMLSAASLPIAGLFLLGSPLMVAAGVGKGLDSLAQGNWQGALSTMATTAAVTATVMLVSLAMYRYYRPLRLRIGTDGVRVEKWFGHRFTPCREVESVSTVPATVVLREGGPGGRHGPLLRGTAVRTEHGVKVLTMTDGEERRVPMAAVIKHEPQCVVLHLRDGTQQRLIGADETVAERIREAIATQQDKRSTGLRIERLDRGELDDAAWKERLAELAKPTQDYRGSQLGKAGLLEVVEDPGTTPQQRVAAAYALSQLDDAPKHRIRVAAQSCADDDLRIALEEAARGELENERIERAMMRFGPD